MGKIKTKDVEDREILNYSSTYKVTLNIQDQQFDYLIQPSCFLYEYEWDKMTKFGQESTLINEAQKRFWKDNNEIHISELKL